MRSVLSCAAASALLFVATAYPAIAGEEVAVRQLGNAAYELTLRMGEPLEIAAGQAQLKPTAQKLCGENLVAFGQYSFARREPVDQASSKASGELLLRQEIRCGSTAPEKTASAKERPSTPEEDQKQVEALTYQYLKARDSGDFAKAYGFFADSMKATVSQENWSSDAKKFNAVAGPVTSRSIRKITRYDNPPSAPRPGIYIAADLVSQFQNMDVHCGYVVWYGQSDGSFQVIREEANYISKATQQRMTPEQLTAFKAGARC
ncbi:DUF4019 domain-containing protein [Variovorax sp. W6]|uniref:DUF4019 domain-containing protein n=1 Tax=Variovorax sp. W6 TaxID=3093895 RepID=UPI003D8018A3